MKNTKSLKLVVVLWIIVSEILLTWKAVQSYQFDLTFFYLFFIVLYAHILYAGFKFVDAFGIEFKPADIFFNTTIVLLILLIAYFYPNLILQFSLLSLFFAAVVLNYFRLLKKARNLSHRKFAWEKLKLDALGILFCIVVLLVLCLFPWVLFIGIFIFLSQLVWIFSMFFVIRIYDVES